MHIKLNIGFVSFSGSAKEYRSAIGKFDNLLFKGVYFPKDDNSFEQYDEYRFDNYQELLDNVDIVVFCGEKIQRKFIVDAIRRLKHVLIDDYSSVLNDYIGSLCNFAAEADIVSLVSLPKLYYWGIYEIHKTYKNIRYLHLDKGVDYNHQRATVDIIPEMLAVIKLADSEVVAIQNKKMPLFIRKSELHHINFEFLNGLHASIKANPCAFYDNYELTIVAEKNMALIDLRKREWHNLIFKSSTAEPVKEHFSLDEIPFIERDEIKELLLAIETKTEPFVSLKSMRSLWKCIELMKTS